MATAEQRDRRLKASQKRITTLTTRYAKARATAEELGFHLEHEQRHLAWIESMPAYDLPSEPGGEVAYAPGLADSATGIAQEQFVDYATSSPDTFPDETTEPVQDEDVSLTDFIQPETMPEPAEDEWQVTGEVSPVEDEPKSLPGDYEPKAKRGKKDSAAV